MKKKHIVNLLIIIILSGCSSSKVIQNDSSVFQIERPKLQEIDQIEHRIHSKEVFKTYTITLSDQYFPGVKNFDFAQPKIFVRKKYSPNPIVSYFYTEKDSIVRLIEYSWDNLKDDNSVKVVFKENTKFFDDYFKKEGKLTVKDEPTYWQEELVWENDEVYVFQFILGNNRGAYRTRSIIRWK